MSTSSRPNLPRSSTMGAGLHRTQTRKQFDEAKINLGKLKDSVDILNTEDSPRKMAQLTAIDAKKVELLEKRAKGPMAEYGGKSLADMDVRKKLRSEVRKSEAERIKTGEGLTPTQKEILKELNKIEAHTNLATAHPLEFIHGKYKKEDIDVVNEFRRPGKLSRQLEADIAASRDALSELDRLSKGGLKV